MLEIFERWIIRRKINFLKDEFEHTRDDAKRRTIREMIAAEQEELQKTLGSANDEVNH